jgi:hypothetical protein
METLDEITKSVSSKTSFFNHVFNFNDDSKNEMLNIVQYAVLAIIPVIILNKATQRIIPEADDEKGTPEIAIEVVLQTVSMFLGILIIHRIITFIPTHSGVKYSPLSVSSNILAVLVIILSLQTKLGEKVSILVDRSVDLWEGKTGDDKAKLKKRSANVKVSQPISQNNQISQSLGYSGSGGGSTPISQLPIAPQITKPQEYANSYHQSNTYGAQQPQASYMNNQMMESNEPVAANFGGGSSFGSSF